MKYRLLFLDLDGTLVGSKDVLSERTVRALNRAREAGCELVICTGRNRYTVEAIARQWPGHAYAILSNGAVVAEWESGRILHRFPVPSELVRQAVRMARPYRVATLCFGVYDREDGGRRVVADAAFPLFETYASVNATRIEPRPNLLEEGCDPTSIGSFGPRDVLIPLADVWQKAFGDQAHVFNAADLRYGDWSLFATASTVSKARGATIVAELLNVPREETLAIGDHLNDLDLLAWAGLGVCMGDGHPTVIAAADYVTGAFDEDGAATAIERLVLGEA